MDSSSRLVFVSHDADSSISVIDPDTRDIMATVPLRFWRGATVRPIFVDVDPATRFAYIAELCGALLVSQPDCAIGVVGPTDV
jgi:DNA-binding beta-propeller fold protein YncE